MAFTSKKKTPGKVYRYNKRCVEEPDFQNLLNADPVLKATNQAMVTILGSVKAATVGGATGNIQSPPPFPCPQNRWLGNLDFDNTDPDHVNSHGKKDYPYVHAKAFAANAATFRDRTEDLVLYYSAQDDLINADTSYNRGGVAGANIGKP
jgi:hypothetical protein